MNCGCHFSEIEDEIYYCDTHEAAFDLLEALENLARTVLVAGIAIDTEAAFKIIAKTNPY